MLIILKYLGASSASNKYGLLEKMLGAIDKYFVAYIRRRKASNNINYNIIIIYANITRALAPWLLRPATKRGS